MHRILRYTLEQHPVRLVNVMLLPLFVASLALLAAAEPASAAPTVAPAAPAAPAVAPAAPAVAPAASAVAPGLYAKPQRWETVSVTQTPTGLRVELSQIVHHVCGFGADVDRAGRLRFLEVDSDTQKRCDVRLKKSATGIELVDRDCEDLRSIGLCGASAGIELGAYTFVPPACAPDPVSRTRKTHKALYDQKELAAARDVLAPVLRDCTAFLRDDEAAWIRNDLAITLHHLGDDDGCRATLAPVANLAKMEEGDLVYNEFYEIGDFRDVVGATRSNLELCRKH